MKHEEKIYDALCQCAVVATETNSLEIVAEKLVRAFVIVEEMTSPKGRKDDAE